MPMKEACGVFGIYGHPKSVEITYYGLYALQHRGQESAGIAFFDGKRINIHKGMGIVNDVFTEDSLNHLNGLSAIGHCRYSTTGDSDLKNAQPLFGHTRFGTLAIAHNGNLVNSESLRANLQKRGAIFTSQSDTELILHLITLSNQPTLEDAVVESLDEAKGAYSIVILSEKNLITARDPLGFRPLVLGEIEGSPVVASETCALDLLQAKYIREIEPGEVLCIGENGNNQYCLRPEEKRAPCVFELIYFSRPDSIVFGKDVAKCRRAFGSQLAIEHPVDADLVVPVPDSGVGAAIGYSRQSGIPFEMGLIRNHYVGRTFIQPRQIIRDFGVKIKLNPIRSIIKNKRIILIDDSIVRGTTSRRIVRMLKEAGAVEVHLRISSPPIPQSCYFGIDTPDPSKLIASEHSIDEIRRFVEADSLGYLSIDGVFKAIGLKKEDMCHACFGGIYPVELKGVSQMEIPFERST